ncbi:MAG: TetR/AcrR family transcriptional regulator, partial [Oscillospiraceae bacterium]|nr:TetR/AcrR family transcriptional regulator [Oscillospiraceae bacterium]
MARINRAMLTKAEIIQVATKLFLQNGYSTTTTKAVCDELQMSKGNLTFHYPTKDHLLAVLVEMLCSFQWEMMEQEANEGYSSIMAICLELMAMASMCEIDEVAKDLYISAYTSTMSLEIIRRNDARRAKMVFAEYCRGWSDEQFAEAETLVSG